MRLMALTIMIGVAASALADAWAATSGGLTCSDRNALDSMAIDARLVAIRLYYEGFVHGLTDQGRQACYEAKALDHGNLSIINRTLDLIERTCAPIDAAARLATQDACP